MESGRHKVILGVTESDAHVIANQLLEICLTNARYEVINLGACTPLDDFMRAYQRHPDVLAIVLGNLNGQALSDLASLPRHLMEYQVRCPVFLGGQPSVAKVDRGHSAFSALGITQVVPSFEDLLILLDALASQRELTEFKK